MALAQTEKVLAETEAAPSAGSPSRGPGPTSPPSSSPSSRVASGNEEGQLRGVFTSFNADTPLLDVEVDRQKAKALGVPIEQVFGTAAAS